MKDVAHIPVLEAAVLKYCRPGLHWDATLGLAGHAIAYLKKFPHAKLIGSDTDQQMLSRASERLRQENLMGRVSLEHSNFSNAIFGDLTFDSILLDLGISSLHLDELDRGISFRYEQELDMRLDISNGIPLKEWLATASEYEIRKVIFEYGEERSAPKIARAICRFREREKLLTTLQLREIIVSALPKSFGSHQKHTQRHPEVKTFQAFRIFINNELEVLKKAMLTIPYFLKSNGRLIIITFHSLEDRIVKRAFRDLEKIYQSDPMARSNWKEGEFKVLSRKPVIPTQEEVLENFRARSAKMRVLERRNSIEKNKNNYSQSS